MTLIQDLRLAGRLIVKDRSFSAVAILALALGIGVNATVCTLVNAVLIRGLPFHHSEQLYMLGSLRAQDASGAGGTVSYKDLRDWREARSFVGVGGFAQASFNIADD